MAMGDAGQGTVLRMVARPAGSGGSSELPEYGAPGLDF
jgi:hypothetical protein